MITNKICCTCKAEKEHADFHKNKLTKDGLAKRCKTCAKNYHIKNIDTIKKNKRLYYEDNKTEIKNYQKQYRLENKEKVKKDQSEYREKHKEKLSKYNKNYVENNKEKISNKRKEYLESNMDVKFKCMIRSRFSQILKSRGVKKSTSVLQLIGCKIDFFIEYIENKFTKNMSWNNYGVYGWHLDHIIPCSHFDLSNKDEQRRCFHYSNLQPLWATTEIAIKYGESDKYIGNLEKQNKIISGVETCL